MRLRSLLLAIVAIAASFDRRCLVGLAPIICGGAAVARSGLAAGPCRRRRGTDRPSGLAEGARALSEEVREGAVNNPCYFAMDATRPGSLGRRFYIICEADRTFRAVPSGHGDGRNLEGIADFANDIRCAKNFSNALDSQLTTGGPYVTAEIRTSFKGYYRDPGGNSVALMRSFVQFDGEGDAANARRRAMGAIRPCW